MIWIVTALLIVVAVLFAIYNRLVRLRNMSRESWRDVDTELQRRYDLIPNLVSTVKGYAAHERETFDVVTISWALRNVNDVTVALTEMLRVTKPGGRLVVLENSHPTWKPFRVAYLEYMMRAVPVVAKAVSTNIQTVASKP